jgi:hypothetical protein
MVKNNIYDIANNFFRMQDKIFLNNAFQLPTVCSLTKPGSPSEGSLHIFYCEQAETDMSAHFYYCTASISVRHF